MNRRSKLQRVLVVGGALLSMASLAVGQGQMPGPTEHHKHFEKSVGSWDAKLVMMGMESTGTEVNTLICGGMFLSSDISVDMNGMAFSGHGIYGYDPKKSKYTGFWVDNMSAGTTVSEGTLDDDGALVMWSKMLSMVTGDLVDTKMVDSFTDATHRTLIFSQPGADGKQLEFMRIEYTRTSE